MQVIKEYLEELMKYDKIASRELKNAKEDQRHILIEMDNIRKEIDKLINTK